MNAAATIITMMRINSGCKFLTIASKISFSEKVYQKFVGDDHTKSLAQANKSKLSVISLCTGRYMRWF